MMGDGWQKVDVSHCNGSFCFAELSKLLVSEMFCVSKKGGWRRC